MKEPNYQSAVEYCLRETGWWSFSLYISADDETNETQVWKLTNGRPKLHLKQSWKQLQTILDLKREKDMIYTWHKSHLNVDFVCNLVLSEAWFIILFSTNCVVYVSEELEYFIHKSPTCDLNAPPPFFFLNYNYYFHNSFSFHALQCICESSGSLVPVLPRDN